MNYTLANIANILKQRLITAVLTIPSIQSTYCLLVAIFIYAVLALSVGFKTKFLELKIERSWLLIIRVLFIALFTPAIIEEIFFRVLLLPHPLENSSPNSLLFWALISLFLFVIYHPVNGFTLFAAGKKTFINPVFLFLATGLGIVCTFIYLNSGSLWTSVIFHWLAVVVWLLYLGGNDKLIDNYSNSNVSK